jgi:hypothetical protein
VGDAIVVIIVVGVAVRDTLVDTGAVGMAVGDGLGPQLYKERIDREIARKNLLLR